MRSFLIFILIFHSNIVCASRFYDRDLTEDIVDLGGIHYHQGTSPFVRFQKRQDEAFSQDSKPSQVSTFDEVAMNGSFAQLSLEPTVHKGKFVPLYLAMPILGETFACPLSWIHGGTLEHGGRRVNFEWAERDFMGLRDASSMVFALLNWNFEECYYDIFLYFRHPLCAQDPSKLSSSIFSHMIPYASTSIQIYAGKEINDVWGFTQEQILWGYHSYKEEIQDLSGQALSMKNLQGVIDGKYMLHNESNGKKYSVVSYERIAPPDLRFYRDRFVLQKIGRSNVYNVFFERTQSVLRATSVYTQELFGRLAFMVALPVCSKGMKKAK